MKVGARFVLVPALMGALTAACTELSSGTAVFPGSDVTTAASAPTSSSVPARPRELRLNGKEPCALVPRTDWAKFDIEKPGTTRQDETLRSPKCSYGTNTGGAEIILVLTEGIERWTDGSRRAEPHRAAPVEGFPAISLTLPTDKDSCDVAVDVAPGQYLYASKVVISDGSGKPLPAPCDWAHQLAESAMRTLVAS